MHRIVNRARKAASFLLRYFSENPGAIFIILFQISLIMAAYYLVLGKEGLANNVAIYAYYFLVLGVMFYVMPTKLAGTSLFLACIFSIPLFFILNRDEIIYPSFILSVAIIFTVSSSLFSEGRSRRICFGRISKFLPLIPYILVILSPLILLVESPSLAFLRPPLLLLVFTVLIGTVLLSSPFSMKNMALASGLGISLSSALSLIALALSIPVSLSISVIYAFISSLSLLRRLKSIKSESSAEIDYRTVAALIFVLLFFLLGLFEVTKPLLLSRSPMLDDYIYSKLLKRKIMGSELGDRLGTSLFLSAIYDGLRITGFEGSQPIVSLLLFLISILSALSLSRLFLDKKTSIIFVIFLFLFSGSFWLKALQSTVYGTNISRVLPLLPTSSYDMLSLSSQTFLGSSSNLILIILISSFIISLKSSGKGQLFLLSFCLSLSSPLALLLILIAILLSGIIEEKKNMRSIALGILASLPPIILSNLSSISVYAVVALCLIICFGRRLDIKLPSISRRAAFYTTYILISLFFISLLAWLSYPWGSESRITPMFSLLFITELPGMLGYLALFSLFFFLSGEERGEGYRIFLSLFLLSFLSLYVLSYLNLCVYNTQLSLQHAVDVLCISLAFLASSGLVKAISILKSFKFSKYLLILLICFVFMYGLSSYAVVMNSGADASKQRITKQEMEAINFLDSYFSSNKNAVLITSEGAWEALASAPPDYLREGFLLFRSSRGELIDILLSQGDKSILIYMRKGPDLNSFFYRNYLSSLKPLFEDNESVIYEVPSSGISPISKNVLILPSEKGMGNYTGLLGLIRGLKTSFTTVLDVNADFSAKKNFFLLYDPPISALFSPSLGPFVHNCMDFISRGGNLTVFNTNGYNLFTHRVLQPEERKVKVKRFVGSRNISIPETEVDLLLPPSEATVISYLEGDGVKVPFVVRMKIGNGTLTVVNVHSLIDKKLPLDEFIGLSNIFPKEEVRYVYSGSSAAFAGAKIQGKAVLSSDSVISGVISMPRPPTVVIRNITVSLPGIPVNVFLNGQRINVTNVSAIRIKKMERISLEASTAAIMKEGNGFSQKFSVEGAIWIKFPGYSEILLEPQNRSFNGSDIALNFVAPSGFVVQLLQPKVSASGNITFSSFYSFDRNLPLFMSSNGTDLSLEGNIDFEIIASGDYKLIRITGLRAENRKLNLVDDGIMLPYIIFWIIAVAPLLLFSILIREAGREDVP
ncbi:hypothetical protein [Candidatus Methanodesulfokora washburnensis]|uniref:Uncharacterized protein n=1 Tax=Candidatus Methanodesulfokora washburnensis TaxID=2478471 RepID=A0A429GM46_9CREN|nr:hypothetical protein [Candidatus Methanodesulfokores washburnensis]RSN74942.1 hypothetical protein D6D85_07310 [Candidatus Methanodesulfokores washburnensis]